MSKQDLKALNLQFDPNYSYIYIWVSKKTKSVYVGQTYNKRGAIGRAYEHVSSEGTLRKRFLDVHGMQLEQVNDLFLLSFPLPKEGLFCSSESSYRIAVEYHVQIKLLFIRDRVDPIFRIISNVTSSEYSSHKRLQMIADDISERFLLIYEAL